MTAADLEDLYRAVRLLEQPGLAGKLADMAGRPVRGFLDRLPVVVNDKLRAIVSDAMLQCLKVAISTIDTESTSQASRWLPKLMTGITGGLSGLIGLPALAVELPVTTTVMLRSIAEIARSEGENLRSARTKLACLEVFALGGRGLRADTDISYYSTRTILAQAMREAATLLVERGVAEQTAPVMMRLVNTIATRYGLVVSEKLAAGAIPIIGALGGATVNMAFMDYFQNLARGHFIIRRLERKYGGGPVQSGYVKSLGRLALPAAGASQVLPHG